MLPLLSGVRRFHRLLDALPCSIQKGNPIVAMLAFPRAAVDEAQIRARIYAAEQSPGLVGSVLGRYRMLAGLSPAPLAARLGMTLAALAGLAHETRPRVVGIDGTIRREHGIAELAVYYRADADQLVDVFNLKARGSHLVPLA